MRSETKGGPFRAARAVLLHAEAAGVADARTYNACLVDRSWTRGLALLVPPF